MTDEYSAEYEVTETLEALETVITERLMNDPERDTIQIFEGIELDFEVEDNPTVTIKRRK